MLDLDERPRHWSNISADLDARPAPGVRYKRKGKERYAVLDACAAFDTETTSLIYHKYECVRDMEGQANERQWKKAGRPRKFVNKAYSAGAILYVWMFALDGIVYVGRTREEYQQFVSILSNKWNLSTSRRLIPYVHNLGFDFQFIKRWFEWEKVFATAQREPVTALDTNGFEYHCSYKLTLASLEYVATQLKDYRISKLSGSLDYTKIRTPETPLTAEEWRYCTHDVLVLNALIDERRRSDGGINMIPLTSTGYVREECKARCFAVKGYRKWIKQMLLTPEIYEELKHVTGGGFVHSSVWGTGIVHHDVTSVDEASAYPTMMIAKMYPMGTFHPAEDVEREGDLAKYKNKAWYAHVTFRNLESSTNADFTISKSKCDPDAVGVKVSNGRVMSATRISTWITDVDYEIHKDFYDWDKMEVLTMKYTDYGYLPLPIVQMVLHYYKAKTELKCDKSREGKIAYNRAKALLNSIFGMLLTDPVRDEITYYNPADDEATEWDGWTKPDDKAIEEILDKHNGSRSRFGYWAWGIWVTAHARRAVTRAIKECGEDYLYCDTDSDKILHYEDHAAWFEAYADEIKAEVGKALIYHGIDPAEGAPEDAKGVKHPMGVFEDDGFYTEFKTLGAKRYMYRGEPRKDGNDIYTTVAGCNKEMLADYLWKSGDPFGTFRDGLVVPEEYSGRKIHQYHDELIEGDVVDYLGNKYHYKEYSGVSLRGTEYHFGADDEFLHWIAHTELISVKGEYYE